jgi:hypothetical protein
MNQSHYPKINQAITNYCFILPFHLPPSPLRINMSNYPRAHTRGSRRGRSRPSLLPRGRAYGHVAMNPAWVHGGGEMVDENVYMEDKPAGWESYNMAHSSSYSNAPIIYTQQSSSTSSFPNTQPQFGSYTNPHQPQFTFTPTNAPSSIRGRMLQQEPTTQAVPSREEYSRMH